MTCANPHPFHSLRKQEGSHVHHSGGSRLTQDVAIMEEKKPRPVSLGSQALAFFGPKTLSRIGMADLYKVTLLFKDMSAKENKERKRRRATGAGSPASIMRAATRML